MIQTVILSLCSVFLCLLGAKGLFHYFQLESYQYHGFFKTLLRNPLHAFLPGIAACALAFLLGLVFSLLNRISLSLAAGLVLPVSLGLGLLLGRLFSVKNAKKKMVFTPRLKRLYGVSFVVLALLSFFSHRLLGETLGCLWALLLPLWVALSGLLAWPMEKVITECYFQDARRKLLSDPSLIRIGITGSYGKTTVKHILGTILSEKYPVLYTPASFNTPMGVTRTIREKLLPSHRVFIAEMGARHVGDIKELCRLVKPQYGLITSVGPQHLDTFKTVERVAGTKYELIEALPEENSHSFFWDDGAFLTQMNQKTRKPHSLAGNHPDGCACWYDGLSSGPDGSTFRLHFADGTAVDCQTVLLGRVNVQNITLAAMAARELGLTQQQIARGISRIKPVKHRMEILRNPGGFTVIDDAFNANPVGAQEAMNIISEFPGRKIVITPGMVELGSQEAELNRAFGRQIAQAADIAIIIGKNRVKPILEGLKEAGMPENRVHQVDSLQDSTLLLHQLVKPGDVVLYENDLPDHYQES